MLICVMVTIFVTIVAQRQVAMATDFEDAPVTIMDPVADLGDLYAWHTDRGTTVLVLTFAGQQPAGVTTLPVDEAVGYKFHIDNDNDGVADHTIYTEFGENILGQWGFFVSQMPGGVVGRREGPAGWVLHTSDNGRAFGGLAEDPAFVDLVGVDGVANGQLTFDASRDTFAGLNTMVIALEFDTAEVLGSGTTFQVWAVSTRRGPLP